MRVNAVISSFNGHVEVAKLLLEDEADITVANNEEVTPVITASLSGLQIWMRRVVATAVSCCVMAASSGPLELIGHCSWRHSPLVTQPTSAANAEMPQAPHLFNRLRKMFI
jgi:hypothetical protein